VQRAAGEQHAEYLFASTIYQAQASLLAEQAANPGTMNAIIFLSDGNATAVDNTVWTDLASGSTATSNCPNGQTCVGVNNSNNGIYPICRVSADKQWTRPMRPRTREPSLHNCLRFAIDVASRQQLSGSQ